MDFNQTIYNFYDFGSHSATIVVLGSLSPEELKEAICAALREVNSFEQNNIVSCCTSVTLTEESGRRLAGLKDTSPTNTTYAAEFSTDIVYSGPTCTKAICQEAFDTAINSDAFGAQIGGTVIDAKSFKSAKSISMNSGTSGGSKSSKSGGSGRDSSF